MNAAAKWSARRGLLHAFIVYCCISIASTAILLIVVAMVPHSRKGRLLRFDPQTQALWLQLYDNNTLFRSEVHITPMYHDGNDESVDIIRGRIPWWAYKCLRKDNNSALGGLSHSSISVVMLGAPILWASYIIDDTMGSTVIRRGVKVRVYGHVFIVPLAAHWDRLACNLVIIAVFLAAVRRGITRVVVYSRNVRNLCPKCGYRKDEFNLCPECGSSQGKKSTANQVAIHSAGSTE